MAMHINSVPRSEWALPLVTKEGVVESVEQHHDRSSGQVSTGSRRSQRKNSDAGPETIQET